MRIVFFSKLYIDINDVWKLVNFRKLNTIQETVTNLWFTPGNYSSNAQERQDSTIGMFILVKKVLESKSI